MPKKVNKIAVPWDDREIVGRINRARGAYLERTGREIRWADIGRAMKWIQATTSDVSLAKRPLRVAEIGAIAGILECSAAWIAYGEGAMRAAATQGEAATGPAEAPPPKGARKST